MITSDDLARPSRPVTGRPIPMAQPVPCGGGPVRAARRSPSAPRAGCLIRQAADGSLNRMGLSERDRAILEFEGSWWTEPGPKEAAIKARIGLSASRYRQILAALIDSDEAAAEAPMVIRRLRRERDRRRRARFEGRPADGRRTF